MKLHLQGEVEVRVAEVLGLTIGEWTHVSMEIHPTWGGDDARCGLTLSLTGTPPGTGIGKASMGSVHIDHEGHITVRRVVYRPNHDHDNTDCWTDVQGGAGEVVSVLPMRAGY